jgi:excisionase family DNA binding protein
MAKANQELRNRQVQGPPDQLLTIDEVASWLGVTKTFIYRRTCKGHIDPIPSFRLGGHLRFRRSEVESWIENHRNRAGEAVADAVTRTLYLDGPPRGRRRAAQQGGRS